MGQLYLWHYDDLVRQFFGRSHGAEQTHSEMKDQKVLHSRYKKNTQHPILQNGKALV